MFTNWYPWANIEDSKVELILRKLPNNFDNECQSVSKYQNTNFESLPF